MRNESAIGRRLFTYLFQLKKRQTLWEVGHPILIPNQTANVVQMLDEPPSQEPAFGEGESSESYLPETTYRRHRQSNIGSASRIVAGIGTAFLLIGLFLPMVNAPMGIWLSFIDLPWKAVSGGLSAAAEINENRDLLEPSEPREPRGRKRVTEKPVAERLEPRNETSKTLVLVLRLPRYFIRSASSP